MSAVAGSLRGMSTSHDELDWSDPSLTGRFIVRARRLADLSQRDLATRVGTSQSALGRMEQGRSRISMGTFTGILRQAGLRLAVVDSEGCEVRPVPTDTVRDNQGRRFPAHLDVAPPDEVPKDRWTRPRYDRPEARGWYHLRDARDEVAESSPVRERPDDHPTNAELRRRRRLMRGRQPRVDVPPPPDIVCECPDACFEELCVPECPCQCEARAGADRLRHHLLQRSPQRDDPGEP